MTKLMEQLAIYLVHAPSVELDVYKRLYFCYSLILTPIWTTCNCILNLATMIK